MPEGVLDAAELRIAVGCPLGSRVRTFALKAPDSFSEVAAISVVSRDSTVKLCQLNFCSALGLQGRGARGRSTCSRLWLKKPIEGFCIGRNRKRRGL